MRHTAQVVGSDPQEVRCLGPMMMRRKFWSINAYCSNFPVDRHTASKRLEGVTPDGLIKGRPGYKLETMHQAIFPGGPPGVRTNERFSDEKTRIARAQADKLELENARTRAELLPAEAATRANEAIMIAIRDGALAIPDAIAVQVCEIAVADGPAGVAAFLRDTIETFLHDAADTEIEFVDEGTDPEGSGDLRAA
jgi:hypothetical protein